jgi:hypothetical protein
MAARPQMRRKVDWGVAAFQVQADLHQIQRSKSLGGT